eukprot:SAG31_NODE_2892_length_4944_cov_1.454902_3_plen_216_part_00
MLSADWATEFKIDGLGCHLELRFNASDEAKPLFENKESTADTTAEARQLLTLAAELVAVNGADDAHDHCISNVDDAHDLKQQLDFERDERFATALELLQLHAVLLSQQRQCEVQRQELAALQTQCDSTQELKQQLDVECDGHCATALKCLCLQAVLVSQQRQCEVQRQELAAVRTQWAAERAALRNLLSTKRQVRILQGFQTSFCPVIMVLHGKH